MPGSTPATSQLDWLISTTAIPVLSWSRATRDLLKSFGWGIRALHQLVAATMVPSPRRLPHTISPLEEAGFEPSVPRKGEFPALRRASNRRRIARPGGEGRYRLSLSGSAASRRPASRYDGYWRAPIGSSRRWGLRLDPRAA